MYANNKKGELIGYSWVEESVREYLNIAWDDLNKNRIKPKNKREKHLVK